MSLVSNDVISKIAEVVGGKDAVKIVNLLLDSDEMTEDEIVSKTEIKLNSVRKILYKLYDHSLVALRRTRDKKTGWFIFHWRLQPDQFEGFIMNRKKQILEKLKARLEYETSHDFYHCGNPECRRVPFEEAVELIFRCPNCGKPLTHFDNTTFVKFLEKKIEELQRELNE